MEVKNGNHIRFDVSDCTLNPGELVRESGIYEICHVDEPRVTALFLRNTFFPYCKRCGESVRYKLIQAVPHISEDADFLEDFEEVDNSTTNLTIPNNTVPFELPGSQDARVLFLILVLYVMGWELGVAHGFRFWQQLVQAWAGGSEGGNLQSPAP
jgi:hypothetical protein